MSYPYCAAVALIPVTKAPTYASEDAALKETISTAFKEPEKMC